MTQTQPITTAAQEELNNVRKWLRNNFGNHESLSRMTGVPAQMIRRVAKGAPRPYYVHIRVLHEFFTKTEKGRAMLTLSE